MRLNFTLLVILLSLAACKDKVICPAFQSTYILDDSVRMAYYSYVWKLDEVERTKYLAGLNQPKSADTSGAIVIPQGTKVDYYAAAGQYVVSTREVKKTKYGIVKYEPYWLKNYHLKTAPMENVLTPEAPYVPQMDTSVVEVGTIVAADFTDSLSLDSASVAPEALVVADSLPDDSFELPTLARAPPPPKKPETKYLYRYDPKDKALNVEQDYYNKYFGEYLIAKPRKKVDAPPPPIEAEQFVDDANQSDLDSLDLGEPQSKFEKKKAKKAKKNKPVVDELTEEPLSEEPQEEAPAEPKPTESEDDGF